MDELPDNREPGEFRGDPAPDAESRADAGGWAGPYSRSRRSAPVPETEYSPPPEGRGGETDRAVEPSSEWTIDTTGADDAPADECGSKSPELDMPELPWPLIDGFRNPPPPGEPVREEESAEEPVALADEPVASVWAPDEAIAGDDPGPAEQPFDREVPLATYGVDSSSLEPPGWGAPGVESEPIREPADEPLPETGVDAFDEPVAEACAPESAPVPEAPVADETPIEDGNDALPESRESESEPECIAEPYPAPSDGPFAEPGAETVEPEPEPEPAVPEEPEPAVFVPLAVESPEAPAEMGAVPPAEPAAEPIAELPVEQSRDAADDEPDPTIPRPVASRPAAPSTVFSPAETPWESAAQPAGERRTRWVPPDHHPTKWWVRHRGRLQALEWGATVLFLLIALYYLWMLLFTSPPEAAATPSPPTREEFRERLRSLPPVAVDPAWRVPAATGRWLGIVIHHTDTDGGSPESIDRYHKQNNGWENGLGYHFVVGNGKGMADGEVAVSRRWRDQMDGAHTRRIYDAMRGAFNMPAGVSPNSVLIGVALVGDFENDMPTPRQLAALKGLLTFLRTEYRIGLASIVGHGTIMPTVCPGPGVFVDEVILALANP